MKNYAIHSLKIILICLGSCILASCGTPKDTAASRSMQNLTARYNYFYNANVILDNYEAELSDNYADNFNDILPVYIAPEKFDPNARDPFSGSVSSAALDKVIHKAQTIIAEKSFSNYIDDAYLLLGKAQFLKGNYFVAQEYFDYVTRTYKNNLPIYVQALNGKARSLIQLNNLREAGFTLDTLEENLKLIKRKRAEPLATLAQMSIAVNRYKDAIVYLESALKEGSIKRNEIRWHYILGQLYEEEKNYHPSLKDYIKVQKSNAAFELYFNANLSRIRVKGLLSGENMNRKQELSALLKDDKNTDYIDQIFYQIAESYADEKDYQGAEKYHMKSVNASTRNPYQKGLSYLRIADLNFKEYKNYLKAKAYYDSTVNTLPKNYTGYDLILKKDQNLEYLTSRYESISLQDTLQMIAKLPEPERKPRIEAFVTPPVKKPAEQALNVNSNFPVYQNNPQNSGKKAAAINTFYFANTTAVSNGFMDFKKRWGNRKLEDNWRQSIRSSSQANTQNVANLDNSGLPNNPDHAPGTLVSDSAKIKAYTAALPLSPDLLKASNQKIIDAYYEIANFYQQELNDNEEAAKIYELLLQRFPDNNHLAAINYGLYLSYKTSNPTKASGYKNTVLTQFPSTVYAKTILDPNFTVRQSAQEAEITKRYNNIFGLYEKKDFIQVITDVNALNEISPSNYLSPQFAYLKSIAIGRTNNVDSLISAFKEIVSKFPDDKLISPLVQDHLAYIDQHLAIFKKRKIALTDFDLGEPRFMEQQIASTPVQQPKEQMVVQTTAPAPIKSEAPKPQTVVPVEQPAIPAQPKPTDPILKKPESIFSSAKSETYYFVIDVADASLTLSSSRFGIGQFNRGNYTGNNLKHHLTEFDNDQLIYVGNFSSFDDAKIYAEGIIPQLKQIMKVPENIYSTFIISKENFDKLKNKDLLNKYIEFYKNNY